MKPLPWLLLLAASLAACGEDSKTCYCEGKEAGAEYCMKAVYSGEGCPSCSDCETKGNGTKVSSCSGTKVSSQSFTEDDCSGTVTCYGMNEAGEALCSMISDTSAADEPSVIRF